MKKRTGAVKCLALLLGMALVLGGLAGCGGGSSSEESAPAESASAPAESVESAPAESTAAAESTTPAESAESEAAAPAGEPVKLTWFVDVPSFVFNSEGWGMDDMTKELTEKFGIEIEFVTAADDSGSQLATLISAEDVPDIITVEGLWDSQSTDLIRQMADSGMLYSYNDLIDQYVPEEEKAGFRSDVLAWYALADGKTYAYPNYAYSQDDLPEGSGLIPNRCIIVRADMLEQLGNPDMTSPEGFLDACERAVKEIGTYDGLDVIGMQLYEEGNEAVNIIEGYFAVPWETEDGQAYDYWTSGVNKESYAFLNEAYRRGLILDANYTDSRDQVREKIASGRVFALIAAPQDFTPELRTLYDNDPNAYYVPVVLRNANGDDPVLTDISGWGYLQTCISANCKAPEQLIRMISYLVNDEGAIHMNYGWEGQQWEYNDDGSIHVLDEYQQAANDDPNLRKKLGIGCFDLFANNAFLMQFAEPLDLDDPNDLKTYHTADTYLKEDMAIYSYRPSQRLYDPNDERATKVSEEDVKEDSYMTIAEAELLTAPTEEEFEAKYKEIQETLPTVYDMEFCEEYENDALQAAKEQLGVKFFWPPYEEAAEAGE